LDVLENLTLNRMIQVEIEKQIEKLRGTNKQSSKEEFDMMRLEISKQMKEAEQRNDVDLV